MKLFRRKPKNGRSATEKHEDNWAVDGRANSHPGDEGRRSEAHRVLDARLRVIRRGA